MAEYPHGEPIWESTGVKVAVAAVIVSIFAIIFYLQIRPGAVPAADGKAKPAAQSEREQIRPLPPGDATTSQSLDAADAPHTPYETYPPDYPQSMPSQPSPPPGMPARAGIQNPPSIPSSSPATESRPISAPVAQVHSLSEAEEVMGGAVSEAGKVGVTQTYRLPDQDGGSSNQPLPKNGKQP